MGCCCMLGCRQSRVPWTIPRVCAWGAVVCWGVGNLACRGLSRECVYGVLLYAGVSAISRAVDYPESVCMGCCCMVGCRQSRVPWTIPRVCAWGAAVWWGVVNLACRGLSRECVHGVLLYGGVSSISRAVDYPESVCMGCCCMVGCRQSRVP